MRRARGTAGLAALTITLVSAILAAGSANAEEFWAECISGSVAQTCQAGTWYTGPVAVVWRASGDPEATSPCRLGIEEPFAVDSMQGLTCTARWRGGEADTREFTLHVEVSAPTTEAIPERPPDSNGWYNHPVTITFKGQGYSGPAACQASSGTSTISYAGPDTPSTSVTATCVDPAGKSALADLGLRYDATPPTITGAYPTRPPDFDGWYNHPIKFVFTGTDALSGMEPCSATYSGPNSSKATLIGSCRDVAGNVATYAVSLRYEGTPALSMAASSGDGFVSLRWQSHASVQIVRSPGLHGPRASMLYSGASGVFTDTSCRDGVEYKYTVRARGHAGATATRSVSVTPGPHLLAPAVNAVLSAPPLLRWTAVRGASYYNVQLFKGQKLLSAWPVHTSFQLSGSWSYGGSDQHLAPGRYEWYVWPGFGTFDAAQYGRLIGRGAFVVRAG